MRYLLTLTCLLLVTATLADEPDFDFSSLGAKKALRDYKKALAKNRKGIELKRKKLNEEANILAKTTRDGFVENLRGALKKSMQAGNLEEANKINGAIKSLNAGASPAGTSAADSKSKKAKKSKARIPKNAVQWNGHHYLVSNINVSHPEAKQRCESAGGHLIRIDDAREQEFVARLARKGTQITYWIDGSDRKREGDWLFSDGTRMKFFNWREKQPDNWRGGEHNVQLDGFYGWGWTDTKMNMDTRRGFICEWDE
jgi:hypothetical protein